MTNAEVRPIIIKRKVVKAAGHHGGAWKVAYADFVTAMMAFFLLMWLINATTEEQKGGIADYFSPDIPMSERAAVADGMLNGESILTSEDLADDKTDPEMTEMQTTLNAELSEGADAGELTKHLVIHMTEDGLQLEIVDLASGGLFEPGSAVPSVLLQKIIKAIGPVIGKARNRVGISGHTDATRFINGAQYDNWELSSDRANVTRRLMKKFGTPQNRFASVEGRAASEPLSDDPLAPENRRISITLFHASKFPLAPADDDSTAN